MSISEEELAQQRLQRASRYDEYVATNNNTASNSNTATSASYTTTTSSSIGEIDTTTSTTSSAHIPSLLGMNITDNPSVYTVREAKRTSLVSLPGTTTTLRKLQNNYGVHDVIKLPARPQCRMIRSDRGMRAYATTATTTTTSSNNNFNTTTSTTADIPIYNDDALITTSTFATSSTSTSSASSSSIVSESTLATTTGTDLKADLNLIKRKVSMISGECVYEMDKSVFIAKMMRKGQNKLADEIASYQA